MLLLGTTPYVQVGLVLGILLVVIVVVAFALLAKIWEKEFRPFISSLRFFFYKVQISSRELIPLFMPGSVQWLSELRWL